MDAYSDALSLDDAIGQCFMVGFQGTEPPADLIELIAREHVGGVILFSRNCRGGPEQVRALTARLQAIARASGHARPLLIAIDQENGLVRRLGPGATQFPGTMALGAAGDPDLTEAVARASGEELRALGINLNLAPVADVNNNPANPVIGVRSFGEDPAIVGRHVAAAVRGYTEGGVIATLKHFPGHGDTATDSHLGLPLVPHDRARLEAVELVPFRAGLAAGAECVLMAHVALPQLSGGRAVPATLAPEIVGGLLRGELGFDGVAMTDCLEMDAIARGVGVAQGAVAALLAGNDLVLVSHRIDRQRAALAAVRAALAGGTLSPDALRTAAARVLRLKRDLTWEEESEERAESTRRTRSKREARERRKDGETAEDAEVEGSSPPGPLSLRGEGEAEAAEARRASPLHLRGEGEAEIVGASGGRPLRGEGIGTIGADTIRPLRGEGNAGTSGGGPFSSAAHRELSARAYARGITLVRDGAGLLPLRLATREGSPEGADAPARIVIAVVAWRGPVSKAVDAPYMPEAFADALRVHHAEASLVTLAAMPTPDDLRALREKVAAAEITLLLTLNAHRDPAQAELMRVLAAAARRAAVIAVADPYDAATLPEVPTVLATYDYSEAALEAVAHALFAANPPPGRLPVTIPGAGTPRA